MTRSRIAAILSAAAAVPLVLSSAALAAESTNALPANLAPAVRQAALQAGPPNPAAPRISVAGDSLPGGGVQISPTTVAYQGGTALLTVATGPGDPRPLAMSLGAVSPASDVYYACSSDYFCLYRDAGYGTPSGHTYFAFSAGRGATFQLSAYGFNDVDSSWINYRSGNVRVHNDWTGSPSGAYFVANAGGYSPSIGSYNDQGSGLTYG